MYIDSLKPDTKGRITLGKLAQGVSSYHVTVDEKTGKIILEPFVEVPMREQWLYLNKKALSEVIKGIEESAEGKVISRDDFKL